MEWLLWLQLLFQRRLVHRLGHSQNLKAHWVNGAIYFYFIELVPGTAQGQVHQEVVNVDVQAEVFSTLLEKQVY